MAYESLDELLKHAPKNKTIVDNLIKAYNIINRDEYKTIYCSTSCGSDSDIMMDIIQQCDKDHKVHYIWYNTGLEYNATKEHMRDLEEKYGIEIEPIRTKKPIPWTCRHIGKPFISKRVSDYIGRLQRHNFKWEPDDYETLVKKYPKCQSALQWWTNNYEKGSRFNIDRNRWLREFMIENPPQFNISNKCCILAKESTGDGIMIDRNVDLQMIGIRRAEGGVRSTSHKNCFSQYTDKTDQYRPVFFYSDQDKKEYCEHYGVEHSRCYTEYGLRRTGCCACPFALTFEEELEVIKVHEPKLYRVAQLIFGESYEYTRAYRKYRDERNAELKNK